MMLQENNQQTAKTRTDQEEERGHPRKRHTDARLPSRTTTLKRKAKALSIKQNHTAKALTIL
eukprot:jgi/Botrbrau1/1298/Bobra.0063s0015.1